MPKDTQKVIKELKCTTTKVIKSQRKAVRGEQGTKDLQNSQKTMNKMAVVSPYVLLVTLNVNQLTSPTKSHRMDKWIGKPTYNSMLLYKRLTLALSTQTESEGIEKRYFKQIVTRTK